MVEANISSRRHAWLEPNRMLDPAAQKVRETGSAGQQLCRLGAKGKCMAAYSALIMPTGHRSFYNTDVP